MTHPWKSFIFRTAMIGAGAASLAACQTTSPYAGGEPGAQPNYPTRVEAAPYSPDTVVVTPAQPTAPPPAQSPAQTAVAQAALPPPPPPAPVFRDIITGAVVDADGPPSVHTVRSGDTLSSIAREMDTTAAALARQNDIDDPSKIRPGQRIRGPATRGKAYVVQSGDTLSAIGRRFNVSAAQLASANSMGVNDVIRPNQ